MKSGFYSRIAGGNLKKNYRFFVPRILTEAGLLACYYIVFTLTNDKRLEQLKGGAYIPTLMAIGVAVLTVLSVVLLFYTNSFLMKQRKREFGLYNVLGMGKKHVARVLFFESLFCSLLSVALGLVLGVVFYKLSTLLICSLLNVDAITGFYYFSAKNVIFTAAFFLAADAFAFLFNCLSIRRMNPVELLRSNRTGEKEPRVKWLLLILGVLSLGAGYTLAIVTKHPLKAMLVFFAAVMLVVVGTYCLFITGSTFVLKALKKNKKYYYRKNHMTLVSGLLYRMKQNAVGLASIAILATGVLVMVSSTVSLYAGMEDSLAVNYPQDFYLNGFYSKTDDSTEYIPRADLLKAVEETAADFGTSVQSSMNQKYLEFVCSYRDGELKPDNRFSIEGLGDAYCVVLMTGEQYEGMTGISLNLAENEVAISETGNAFPLGIESWKELTLAGEAYRVAACVKEFPIRSSTFSVQKSIGLIVPDDSLADRLYREQKETYGTAASEFTDRLAVSFRDVGPIWQSRDSFEDTVRLHCEELIGSYPDADGGLYLNYDSVWSCREEFLGLYGSLLFLGIILGLVCLFATVLIIYYKQISEGYEDRERFQILQKIGMSRGEVKKTITGQVLLVFFLPLAVAGVHVAFAFPILARMLHVFLLSKTSLFALCTVVVYLAFAVVYVLIYGGTARTYYKIVR